MKLWDNEQNPGKPHKTGPGLCLLLTRIICHVLSAHSAPASLAFLLTSYLSFLGPQSLAHVLSSAWNILQASILQTDACSPFTSQLTSGFLGEAFPDFTVHVTAPSLTAPGIFPS